MNETEEHYGYFLKGFRNGNSVLEGSDKHDGSESPQLQPFVIKDSCVPSGRVAGRERCGDDPQRLRRGDDGRPSYQPVAQCQVQPDATAISKPASGGRQRAHAYGNHTGPAQGSVRAGVYAPADWGWDE